MEINLKSRQRVLILVGLVLLLSTGCQDAATTPIITPTVDEGQPGSSGAGDSNYPDFGNGGYDVEHYFLDIEVTNILRSSIVGYVEIDATATHSLSSFNLDLIGLDVLDVTVNGVIADYAREGQELTIFPVDFIQEGAAFNVQVNYDGSPHDYISRTFPISVGWVNIFHGVYVINGLDGAATYFPANDTPKDRATYTFLITVPKPFEVVANGRLVETIDNENTTTFRWEAIDPMSSYLTTINVGKFDEFNQTGPHDLPITVYYPEGNDALLEGFVRQPAIIAYFEEVFGPYPFETYGSVVVDTNLSIAMESQTMSVYGKTLVDELTIAHEIAHQWFGDSITVQDSRDIWLHEGFAVYAEALWIEHAEGVEARDELIRNFFAKIRLAKNPYSPPGDPQPDNLWNPGIYYWGAVALHSLREEIGDDAFFESLRAYYERHKGGNVTTEDFVSICEETSGKNLGEFFEVWLYGKEMPTVEEFEPCLLTKPSFHSDGPVYSNGVNISEYLSTEIDPSICLESTQEEIAEFTLTCIGAENFSGRLEDVNYLFRIEGLDVRPDEQIPPGYYRVESNCLPGVLQQMTENIFSVNLFSLLCTCDIKVTMNESTTLTATIAIPHE